MSVSVIPYWYIEISDAILSLMMKYRHVFHHLDIQHSAPMRNVVLVAVMLVSYSTCITRLRQYVSLVKSPHREGNATAARVFVCEFL